MKLEGDVSEIDLLEQLIQLSTDKFTGALRFEFDSVIKIVYLKHGEILSASSNERPDAVDEILLRADKVNREHVKQAMAKRKEAETLGDALLGLGFISRKELSWARRLQVIGIVRSVMSWTEGSYTIVSDYLPKREEGTGFSIPQIVIEMLVTETNSARFDDYLQYGTAILHHTDRYETEYRAFNLNEEADKIVAAVNGTRTVSEVATAAGADEFATTKLLYALTRLQILKMTQELIPQVEHELFDDEEDFAFPAVSEPEVSVSVVDEIREEINDSIQRDEGFIAPTPLQDELPELRPAASTSELDIAAAPEPEFAPLSPLKSNPKAADPAFRRGTSKRGNGRSIAAAISVLLLIAVAYYAYRLRDTGAKGPDATGNPNQVSARKPAPVSAVPNLAEENPGITTSGTPVTAGSGPIVGSAAQLSTSTESAAPATSGTPSVSRPAVTVAATTAAPSVRRGTPAVVSVSPPISPGGSSDSSRARYDAMAAEFAQEATSVPFTLQFELVCQSPSLQKAIEAGGSNVWFVQSTYQGKSCYRVFWGRYTSLASANAAAGTLPAALRGSKPVVIRPTNLTR